MCESTGSYISLVLAKNRVESGDVTQVDRELASTRHIMTECKSGHLQYMYSIVCGVNYLCVTRKSIRTNCHSMQNIVKNMRFCNVYSITSGFCPCAARTRLFGLINTPNGALCAPCPSQLRCSPKNKKVYQKQNASFLARTRAARGVYLSTGLSCTLLSYIAPSWSTLHPPKLRCTLMSYTAPYWATLHPTKLWCIQLSYAAPAELSRTLLSYGAP